jgi:hypothetical protein
MTLNHATGNINGTVLQGQFAERELDSLSATEFKTLYQYCSENDAEALRLPQTYIQRQRASEWTDQSGLGLQGESAPVSTAINIEEAKQVLGLGADYEYRKIIGLPHLSPCVSPRTKM